MFAVLFIAHTAWAEQQHFGYGEIPTLDGQRSHVTDPTTGRPASEGICFVWQRGWRVSRGYMNVEAQRVTRWYTGWAFQIDPRQQAATLSNFSAPMIEETPQGRRRVGPDQMVPRLTVTVPLTTTRPLGCNDRWVAMWTEQNRDIARPAPNPGTRGRGDSTAKAGGPWRPEMGRGQTDPNYCKEHAPSRPGKPNVKNFYKCWAYQHGATEEELNPRVDGLVNEAPSSLYPPDEGKPCTVGDGVHGYRQGWIRGGFCQVN
jgi:hypothetical protein